MAQALSQLLFDVFDTQNYFMKLEILFVFRQNLGNSERRNIYGSRDKQTIIWIQQGQRQLFCGIFIGEIYCIKLEKDILFVKIKKKTMMDSAGGMDRFMA